jgi:hypothetical protein
VAKQTKSVYRFEVPIDDRPHRFRLTGNPLAVAAVHGERAYVEFWEEHDPQEPPVERTFRVFGTGHEVPASATWRGTTGRVYGLVWHLYEIADGPGEDRR